jgi:hypothetical protein
VIAFGFRDPPGRQRWDDLRVRAAELEARYGMEFPQFVAGLHAMNRHEQDWLHP